MNRRAHAALVAAHGVPPVIGTLWLQTVGVAAAPGGRLVWLPLLYGIPALLAAGVAIRPGRAAAVSLCYGLLLVLSALATALWLPATEPGLAAARVLEIAAVACGCALAVLAQTLRASEAASRGASRILPMAGAAVDGVWRGAGDLES